MSEQIVVDNTPKRVMMVSPSGGRNKIEEAERELAELLANRGKVEEPTLEVEDEEQPEEPKVAEAPKPVEQGWEKRYKDAQRYINKLKDQIKELETKTTAVAKPPKSKEEVEAWMKKYPDVASIVETIAAEKAENLYGPMSAQMEQFEEMRIEGIIARTEATILKTHPDYLEIKEDNTFHTWAEDLPKAMQAVLYDTIDDPKGVIKIINMYKLENGIVNDRDDDRIAAQAVRPKGQKTEAKTNRGSYDFLESEIERMSMSEYAKNEAKIREAREKNRIKYDISGR
jgi:hypothetical protein